MDLAVGGRERDAHGGELGARLVGLGGERVRDEDAPEDGRGVGVIARELVGAGFGVAEVDVSGLGGGVERLQHPERGLRVAVGEVEVGEKHRRVGGEDAARMAVGEVVQQAVGGGALVGGEGGLRAQVVGVVAQGVGRAGGHAVGVGGVGEALIHHVGVAQRQVGGGGAVAGVRARVAEHPIVGHGRARGGKLLGHGAQLAGGGEGGAEAHALGGGRWGVGGFRRYGVAPGSLTPGCGRGGAGSSGCRASGGVGRWPGCGVGGFGGGLLLYAGLTAGMGERKR